MSTGRECEEEGMESQNNDEKVMIKPELMEELVAMILARVPGSEYGRLSRVNKLFNSLINSGEVYNLRRASGLQEPTVFMLAVAAQHWWAFDRNFRRLRNLPELPAGEQFKNGDKETMCAGTHLLVSGMEDGLVPTVWRYRLATDNWVCGPNMINPRSMFAATSCGNFGYVAGGLLRGMLTNKVDILSSAERYNSESGEWEILPSMHRKRVNCSGCYMHGRFHVLGGRNDEDDQLTCAEAYDHSKRQWELIPNMLEGAAPAKGQRSPPLVAVVADELYCLDISTNQLKVFVRVPQKSWRVLGPVPVIAHWLGGLGVAFKSFGDELLVIGGKAFGGPGMIFACRPNPVGPAGEIHWRRLEYEGDQFNSCIRNCSVMFA